MSRYLCDGCGCLVCEIDDGEDNEYSGDLCWDCCMLDKYRFDNEEED